MGNDEFNYYISDVKINKSLSRAGKSLLPIYIYIVLAVKD